jgi:hypothetical protein
MLTLEDQLMAPEIEVEEASSVGLRQVVGLSLTVRWLPSRHLKLVDLESFAKTFRCHH